MKKSYFKLIDYKFYTFHILDFLFQIFRTINQLVNIILLLLLYVTINMKKLRIIFKVIELKYSRHSLVKYI